MIVDGTVVTMPVLEAVAVPLVDVRLWLQSVQCELDPSDTRADFLPDCSALEHWLADYLESSSFANSSAKAEAIAAAYCPNSSVERAFESLLADMGVTCGNDLIAATARKSFRSRVIRSHLTGKPSHEYLNKNYAFHTWDYPILGAEYWGPFSPEQSDLNLSGAIVDSWLAMLHEQTDAYADCIVIGDNGVVDKSCAQTQSRCAAVEARNGCASVLVVN